MNKSNHYVHQNHPQPSQTWWRVGDKAFDENWNELPVQNKNGWRCIKRNGAYTGLSSLKDGANDIFPVYYAFVFKGGPGNWYYDKLLGIGKYSKQKSSNHFIKTQYH
jgi:hypothetical protein